MLKSKSLSLLFVLLFIFSCTPQRHLSNIYNKYNFQIEAISELLNADLSSFKEVNDFKRYIIMKNYDFYVLSYEENKSTIKYTVAVSKEMNVFYFLNYPEKFSFSNYNTMIKSEKYQIINYDYALLYLKFMPRLFMPEAFNIDEIRIGFSKGASENPNFVRLLEQYRTTVKFKKKSIYADFYTLSNGHLLFNWQVKLKTNGVITACKITMILLNADYEVEETATILDRQLDLKPKKVTYDPSFYSP